MGPRFEIGEELIQLNRPILPYIALALSRSNRKPKGDLRVRVWYRSWLVIWQKQQNMYEFGTNIHLIFTLSIQTFSYVAISTH